MSPQRSRSGEGALSLDAAVMAELLEELDTGVIVCCEEGRVVLANNMARHALAGGRPLAVDAEGCLCPAEGVKTSVPQWRLVVRTAVQLRRRQLLALQDGSHGLMVAVMPLGGAASRWALVMLGRRQPAPELAVEMFGQLHDLTPAEKAVLRMLLAGVRVEAIARERGVKVSTLRTQVASLREKLGAHRLEDLVRLAAELPPMSTVLRSPSLQALGALAPAANRGFDAGARAA